MAKSSKPPKHDYLIGERTIRTLFVVSAAGGALLIVALLLLMSARPQGRYVTPDRGQYTAALRDTIGPLENYGQDPATGRIQLPIERAIELVAERGVSGIQFGAAAAQAPTTTAEAGEETAVALPDGSQIYANCAGCHGANGQGVPGLAPPLAGHVPDLFATDGGREYLAHVLLYGLQGPITVAGNTYNGVMPPWAHLGDADIAAVLNHILTAWNNEAELPEDFEPYAASDIAAERDLGLTAAQVYEEREALELNE